MCSNIMYIQDLKQSLKLLSCDISGPSATCRFSLQLVPPGPSAMPAVLSRAGVVSYRTRTACVRYVYVCIYGDSFTPISGGFNGGWQLDAVVHPLSVTHPTGLAALSSLLHQEAEDVTWIL